MATFELTTPDGRSFQVDADSPDLAQKAFDHAFGAPPAPPPQPEQSGGIGSTLANAGQFAFTAAARGLGGLADFATDPLSPIRRMIDPRLENLEQSIRPHPGEAAANTAFAATGVPEYKPGGALDRLALSTAEGAVAGGPFGPAAAVMGGLGGLLGQGTHEAATRAGLSPNWSERLATGAGFLPAAIAPVARGTVNAVVGKGRETLGPALSQSYREGLAGEQLRNSATDLEGLKSSLMVDQPGPLNQSLVPAVRDVETGDWKTSLPTTFQLTGDMGLGQAERGARTRDAAPFLDRAAEQNKVRVGQIDALAPENAAPSAVRDLLKQRLSALDTEGEANIRRAQENAQQAFDLVGGKLHPDLYGALLRDQLEGAKATEKGAAQELWKAIDPNGTLTIDSGPVAQAAKQILDELPRNARPPEGEEAAVLQSSQAGGTEPFLEFSARRTRLLDAIRAERKANGESQALRRMQILRSAMDETISSAADQAAQSDAGLLGRLNAGINDLAGTTEQAQTAAGGYNSPGTSTVSSGSAFTAPRGAGTAGNPSFGFGNAAGRAGVSRAPPKPQDIVEFLISRGGVRDDGGELRAMDMNRVNGGYGTEGVGVGQFGILSRKNGLPPDTAREYAVEAGYLHPNATISDLYDAIHDSSRGIPHYSGSDAGIAADWEHYQRTGEAPPMGAMPQEPPNFDAEAAQRARAAGNAWREMKQKFNNQVTGPALQELGSGEYKMRDSRLPAHFLGSPEGIQSFLSAGGDVATLRDAMAADLRRAASNTDGTLNPGRFASWQRQRAASLRAFPELGQTLGDAAKAQEAVDAVSASTRQRSLEFQQGAAKHFLNAEPDKAVQSALASRNPVADFRELARMVGGSADAKAGLQRAVADHIRRDFIGNTEAGTSGIGTMKSDAFQTFLRRNGPALAQIFAPEQIKGMQLVATDLQRSNRSVAGSKIPGQSNTAQDTALQSGQPSLIRRHIGDVGVGAAGVMIGYLLGNVPGALVGGYAGMAKAALSRMKAAGIESSNQLVTEALLNPEIARTLVLKPNPASKPFIARSLRTAFGRLAAASASRQEPDQQQ